AAPSQWYNERQDVRCARLVLGIGRLLGTSGLGSQIEAVTEFTIRPDPDDPRLSLAVPGIDHEGKVVETTVVAERPLTLFLNAREIVTLMTVGDRPELLAIGYLLNQNMLQPDDVITAIDYAEDIATVVVRTQRETNFEDKLKKKIKTSGCAQGTVF